MDTAEAVLEAASVARLDRAHIESKNTREQADDLFARADQYWAGLLSCDVEQLTQTALWVGEDAAGMMLTALWRAGAWKVRFPRQVSAANRENILRYLADFADIADPLPRHAPQANVAYQAIRNELFQLQPDHSKPVQDCVWGPAELLYFDPVQARLAPSTEHRPLTQDDREQATHFRDMMIADGQQMVWAADDLPDSVLSDVIEADWPRMIGVFDGETLIAVSAIRNWANTIAEVFTDILPAYRTQGIGTRISSDLIRWTLEHTDLLIQSDADWMNAPSRHISRQLGFQFYGMLIMSDISA